MGTKPAKPTKVEIVNKSWNNFDSLKCYRGSNSFDEAVATAELIASCFTSLEMILEDLGNLKFKISDIQWNQFLGGFCG